MQANLSPSVNIIRDAERPFHYIETANSHLIFEQIASAFKSGVRTFSIVGSYGTGKSAFLLALMQHFSNPNSDIFEPINGQFNGLKNFEFISIVGENRSFQNVLAEKLEVDSERKAIFAALKKKRDTLKKEEKCCVIVADEFGKFLEYATTNDPSVQIYFLQELAEFVNDPDKNFLFLTTLHKNFDAYSVGESEKREWEKVKGRFKELTFNEPVEQLLRLASEFIQRQGYKDTLKVDAPLLNAIESASAFRLQTELSEDFAKSIYPFDVLSAMTLTVALQRYGQNERSLFSFLTTEEYLGLNNYRNNKGDNPYLNLAWVFDYLTYNFSSTITSKHNNNDFFQWMTLRKTIERVYTHCMERVGDLLKVVKSIGLLDILGSDGAKIDTDFLKIYGEYALGIKDVSPLIIELESKKIIIYQSFKKRFKLFEGTDENIEQLLAKEREKVQLSESLIPELKKYVTEQYHVAKAVSFKTGTPRVFEVKISDKPITVFNEKNNEIDGFINLVFSNQTFDFLEIGKGEPILYGVYKNYENLMYKIKEIQATQKAIDYVRAKGDNVAREEMEAWLYYHLRDLNETINIQLFGESGNVNWYYEGQKMDIHNKKGFNQTLSKICETVYYATPQYRNELINKVSYSSNINAARKNFLTALFEKSPDTNFGYDDEQMPPEKMIYLTLCKHTKLFDTERGDFMCHEPMGNPSFKHLWDVSMAFLDSTKSGKKPLSEWIEKLYEKPFRLKNGLVDFWIIAFLRGHREDIAIFKNGIYVPKVGGDTAELFFREAKNYEVKKFNIDGVRLQLFNKYRELTKQAHQGTITSVNFQETAKPFLVFYNKLPKYTQDTKSVSQDCLAFVKTIRSAKDLEKLFFEDLPIAFGTNIDRLNDSEVHLNEFVNRINSSIAELRQAYDNLIERIEDKILGIFGFDKTNFEAYRIAIQNRYESIKAHLLYERQKAFLSRVRLPLEDREGWINSLAQVILNKQLKDISDEEEIVLNDRLADAFKELDDALTLNTMNFDNEKQQALTIEITGNNSVKVKKNVILSKNQKDEVKNLEKKIQKILKDASPNVYDAVLIGLLNKQHNDKD